MLPLARPPWTKIGNTLEALCRKACYSFDLIGEEKKIAVALSGGKDSLTLLYLLKAMAGRGFPPFQLYAVHVGGEFSCGASLGERWLRPICDALEIPLIVKESSQRLETLECYRCSRERRALIFAEARTLGCTHVAFGHHRDDNVETFLMNLLHKGECAGLLPKVPMHAYGVTIVRPLILASESQIMTFARHYGMARTTCQCPVGQVSGRQTTKLLLRQMEEKFPNARTNLAQAVFRYGSDKALRDTPRFLERDGTIQQTDCNAPHHSGESHTP